MPESGPINFWTKRVGYLACGQLQYLFNEIMYTKTSCFHTLLSKNLYYTQVIFEKEGRIGVV